MCTARVYLTYYFCFDIWFGYTVQVIPIPQGIYVIQVLHHDVDGSFFGPPAQIMTQTYYENYESSALT